MLSHVGVLSHGGVLSTPQLRARQCGRAPQPIVGWMAELEQRLLLHAKMFLHLYSIGDWMIMLLSASARAT